MTLSDSVDGHVEGTQVVQPREDRNKPERSLLRPVAVRLRTAGALTAAAALIWPAQAALLATVLDGWVSGPVNWIETAVLAGAFLVLGLVRAAIDHRAGGRLFGAADVIVARERGRLIRRETRSRSEVSSAAIAATAVQTLPMLHPWITRYRAAMTRTMIVPAVILALALYHSWAVALILAAAGPLIPIFMALVGMAAEDASRKHLREIGTINTMLQDRLGALLDARALGAVGRVLTDFAARADKLRRQTMAVLKIAFLSSAVLELFSALGVAMVAVYVGFSLLGEVTFGAWGGGLTVWQGVFLLLLAPEFFQPMRELATAWHDRAAGRAVLGAVTEIEGSPRLPFLGKATLADPLPGPAALSWRTVSVRLGDTVRPLPDLTLEAGDSAALVGPSGSGKTTILHAIAGLLPLSGGTVTVCGRDLDEQTADSWRRRISLVAQTPHFPATSIGTYLDPDRTGRDPWPALVAAHADGFVRALPDGLQTRLGETGGGLSGGEFRRLMLARAIFEGRDAILADEPTADLDRHTADLVIETLCNLNRRGVTVLVATHDPDLAQAMAQRIKVGS